MTTISEVLKRTIEESGMSTYRIALESGVSNPQIFRFMSGERSLTLPSADRLAEYFGLELVPRTKTKRAKRTRKGGK